MAPITAQITYMTQVQRFGHNKNELKMGQEVVIISFWVVVLQSPLYPLEIIKTACNLKKLGFGSAVILILFLSDRSRLST
jgi:hypothetical protein